MIKVDNIPEWDKYDSRIFKNGILYVTPDIEFDLWEDPELRSHSSVPAFGTPFVKGWQLIRYLSGSNFGPGRENDQYGVLLALAWQKNFRKLKNWSFSNYELIEGERRLFYNEVLSVRPQMQPDEVHHAVLSAEIDLANIDAEDMTHLLKKWIREAPELR